MAKDRIVRVELAGKLLESAASAEDPLRAMVEMIAGFMMEAEVTAKMGAERHERSAGRTTHRNGFRDGRWDTRPGTLSLKVPKLREGGYVPSLIGRRRPTEQALVSAIQEAVARGVSTRKIEAVLGVTGHCGRFRGPSEPTVCVAQREGAPVSGPFCQSHGDLRGGHRRCAEIAVHYPSPYRTRLSSNNPIERLSQEICRRTRVVGMFPRWCLPAADRHAAGGNV